MSVSCQILIMLLAFRAVNFKYIAIEWMKPRTFGDAAVAAYKVYVNGIVEATLSADQMSFSFTKGVACQEYVFQVQVIFCCCIFNQTLPDLSLQMNFGEA